MLCCVVCHIENKSFVECLETLAINYDAPCHSQYFPSLQPFDVITLETKKGHNKTTRESIYSISNKFESIVASFFSSTMEKPKFKLMNKEKKDAFCI